MYVCVFLQLIISFVFLKTEGKKLNIAEKGRRVLHPAKLVQSQHLQAPPMVELFYTQNWQTGSAGFDTPRSCPPAVRSFLWFFSETRLNKGQDFLERMPTEDIPPIVPGPTSNNWTYTINQPALIEKIFERIIYKISFKIMLISYNIDKNYHHALKIYMQQTIQFKNIFHL